MRSNKTTGNSFPRSLNPRNPVLLLLVFLLGFTTIAGQAPQYTKDKADQTLRGSSRVNPSTLGMEFGLTLGSYPGRGINVPISINYSSKLWRFDFAGNFNSNDPSGCSSYYTAKYAENTASGWTSSLAIPYIEYVGKDNPFTYEGFPYNSEGLWCVGSNNYPNYVYRIMVHLPGGESHELRAPSGASWNNTFYSVDSSNLKYIENSSNNTYRLLMPDGSYYDFATGNTTQMNGVTVRKGTQYSDKNGNYISYNNSTGVWTDTLGRTFNAPFGLTAPVSPTASGSPVTYSMPGMTGTYKFHWKNLKGSSQAESGLTDWTQDLRYPGSMHQISQYPWWQTRTNGASLFNGRFLPNSVFNPIVLTEVELPTGEKYRFTYDIYGRIERIYYPTGGEERLTYSQILPLSYSQQANMTDQSNYGVTHREVYETSGSGTPSEWDYAIMENGAGGYKVSTTAPDGTVAQRFLHRGDEACVGCDEGNFGYDNALAGMPYEERQFSSTGLLLSRKLTHWAKSTTAYTTYHVDWSPRIDHEESYTYDSSGNGVYSTTKYEYEGDLSSLATPVLVKKTTDWGFQVTSGGSSITPSATPSASPTPVPTPVPSPSPVRSSESTYLVNDPNYSSVASTYADQNMFGLVTVSKVKDSAGTTVSQGITVYDESGRSPGYRGNPTTVKAWDSSKGVVTSSSAYTVASSKFDSYGNLYESTDANGNTSTTTFDSTYHAYPVQVTSPVPDSYGTHGSNMAFVTSTAFDTVTGLPLSTTDPNGLETRIEYDPVTLRPLSTETFYDNVQVGSTAETVYNDELGNIWIKNRSQIDEDHWAESITHFDGLGRAWKTEKINSNGNIFVEKEFDAEGRVLRVSNPYRSGDTKLWTVNTYDQGGRLWKVTTPDDAVVETVYGVASSGNQIGTFVTVTDQAGKLRRSITNAMGQLIRVDEPTDSGGLGTISSPNQDTRYSYDTLNNLTDVVQGAQPRSYTYSSLSRILSASNPESGTISYTYDNNGNLTTKTDARNITVASTYDRLNRVKTRSYSGESGYTTPTVSYYYDNLTNAKGKQIKVSSSVSVTEYLAFDPLGHVTRSKQVTDGVTYGTDENPITYSYNLSGALIEQKYPSGRIVTNVFDENGDLSIVRSKKSDIVGYWNYADSFTYNARGSVVSMQLGNGRWESAEFNSRNQVIQTRLGSVQNSADLWSVNYDFGVLQTNGAVDSSKNNGNVAKQTTIVPTLGGVPGFTVVQSHSYDSLDRLSSVTETSSTQTTWQQTFLYDRYGNRRFDPSQTTTIDQQLASNISNPVADTEKNRFTSSDGYTYDPAGHLIQDATGSRFSYDGDGKMVKYYGPTNTTTTPDAIYVYDGDGRRVSKTVGNVKTIFVYDASYRTIAEYSNEANSESNVNYITKDDYGSPRLITNRSGQVVQRRDYMPFGEELLGYGNRTEAQGYSSNSVRTGFAGQIKDEETGFDYFGERYYTSAIGRFNSPDPLMASGGASNPQSWNRYAYVVNNPIAFIDVNGELKRDKNGKVVVENDGSDKDSYNVGSISTKGRWVTIRTDDGRKIDAFQNSNYEGEGNGSLDYNCHGLTFTQGQLLIENDQVQKILDDDYTEVKHKNGEKPQVGDIVVYYSTDEQSAPSEDGIVHSATITETNDDVKKIKVSGLGGAQTDSQTTEIGKGWKNIGPGTLRYRIFRRNSNSEVEPNAGQRANTARRATKRGIVKMKKIKISNIQPRPRPPIPLLKPPDQK